MDLINRIFDTIFDFIFVPFDKIDAAWGMLAVSFLTSILMLLIFKKTSDQAGIKRAKNRVKGHFLAIRLYKDDLGLMFETMKNILVSNGQYMKKSMRPMLFLLAPVVIIIIQIGARYEHRPLRIGEHAVVTAQLDENAPKSRIDAIELQAPHGVKIDAQPVRIHQLREVSWRIKAVAKGIHRLTFDVDGQSVSKQIQIHDELKSLAPQVAKSSLFVTLMNPAAASLPEDSWIESILVQYPKREFAFLGLSGHWLIAFFLLSILGAFLLKGIMKVEV